MRIKSNKKIISWLLYMMLIVTMAFTTVGCGTNNESGSNHP